MRSWFSPSGLSRCLVSSSVEEIRVRCTSSRDSGALCSGQNTQNTRGHTSHTAHSISTQRRGNANDGLRPAVIQSREQILPADRITASHMQIKTRRAEQHYYSEWSFRLNPLISSHHTHTHTHTHTHVGFPCFMGTFHRRNGFYTVQTVYSIPLHCPYP